MHWIASHHKVAVLMSLNARLIRLVDFESSAKTKTKIRPTIRRSWHCGGVISVGSTSHIKMTPLWYYANRSLLIGVCVCVSVGDRATHYTGANSKWHTLRPSAW